jgi:hypothetical protein
VSDGCLLKGRAASGRQVSKWIHRIEIFERVIVRIRVLSMLPREEKGRSRNVQPGATQVWCHAIGFGTSFQWREELERTGNVERAPDRFGWCEPPFGNGSGGRTM